MIDQICLRDILEGIYFAPLRDGADEFLSTRRLVGEKKALSFYHNNDTRLIIEEIDRMIRNMNSNQYQVFSTHLLTARNVGLIGKTGIPINKSKLKEICREMQFDGKKNLDYTKLRKDFKVVDGNTRLYCNWNPYASVTGRIQSYRPNVQGFPKVVRESCFSAPKGKALIYADYQSAEIAIMSALAKDDRLLSQIEAGVDFHREVASILFRHDSSLVSDEERGLAKRLTFATLYGAKEKTLERIVEEYGKVMLRMSGDTIKHAILDYYPAITKLEDSIRRSGRIILLDGRQIPLDKMKPYAFLNRMIQSDGAILFKDAVNELITRLPACAKIVCLIHDEIIVEVELNWIEECIEIIKTTMQNVILKYGINALMPIDIVIK